MRAKILYYVPSDIMMQCVVRSLQPGNSHSKWSRQSQGSVLSTRIYEKYQYTPWPTRLPLVQPLIRIYALLVAGKLIVLRGHNCWYPFESYSGAELLSELGVTYETDTRTCKWLNIVVFIMSNCIRMLSNWAKMFPMRQSHWIRKRRPSIPAMSIPTTSQNGSKFFG